MLGKKVCNLTLEKSGLCNIEKKRLFWEGHHQDLLSKTCQRHVERQNKVMHFLSAFYNRQL